MEEGPLPLPMPSMPPAAPSETPMDPVLEAAVAFTIPSALHHLHMEWRRFHRERLEWTMDRAQLCVRPSPL